MKWNALQRIEERGFFSADLKAHAAAINDRIGKLLADRAGLDARQQRLTAGLAEDVDPQRLKGIPLAAEGNRVQYLEMLGIELNLRDALSRFYLDWQREGEMAAGDAWNEHERTGVKLIEKLIAIGFDPPDAGTSFAIIPMFRFRNRDWQRTKEAAEQLTMLVGNHAEAGGNAAAVTALKEEIDALRKKYAGS